MDIPDLEELEWLESNTLDDQFDDDFELEVEPPSPPSSPSSDKPPKRPILSLPPKPSPLEPHPQINTTAKKRTGSDLRKSISLDVNDDYDLDKNGSGGKRSRTGEEEARNEKFAQPKCPDVGPVDSDEISGAMMGPEVSLNGNVGSGENNEGSDDDEEWLRYSPPRGTVEEMEVVEEETEERVLSRYATEIDGDCVPVTGLDGERVYAKMCRIEMDEEARNKKLNFRGDLNGEAIIFDVFACLNCYTCNLFHLD